MRGLKEGEVGGEQVANTELESARRSTPFWASKQASKQPPLGLEQTADGRQQMAVDLS